MKNKIALALLLLLSGAVSLVVALAAAGSVPGKALVVLQIVGQVAFALVLAGLIILVRQVWVWRVSLHVKSISEQNTDIPTAENTAAFNRAVYERANSRVAKSAALAFPSIAIIITVILAFAFPYDLGATVLSVVLIGFAVVSFMTFGAVAFNAKSRASQALIELNRMNGDQRSLEEN